MDRTFLFEKKQKKAIPNSNEPTIKKVNLKENPRIGSYLSSISAVPKMLKILANPVIVRAIATD
ncbi:MAG: hypothetical protein M0Q48_07485 [Verrucomicrobia bacterium]|nr:hypothetical protein [Verrucomicrobiota bacterium]